MSKPTGFMEYKRIENGNVPPLERITNFKEFHPKLDEKARREQAKQRLKYGALYHRNYYRKVMEKNQ